MRKTVFVLATVASLTALLGGCVSNPNRVTNGRQPGPAVGASLGAAVGSVGGNVTGGVVGFGEGVVAGSAVPFDNTHRVVRRWRTETTSDGRTIQVAEDVLVDAQGSPIERRAKK